MTMPEFWNILTGRRPSISITKVPMEGRWAALHTPDFFVIRETEAGWEEWKTEEDLRRLTERNPQSQLHSPRWPLGLSCWDRIRGAA